MDLKKTQKVMSILMSAGSDIFLISALLSNKIIQWTNELTLYIIMGVGLLIATVGFFVAFKFYRCPHCHKRLSLKGLMPEYCPHCKTHL